MNDVLEITEWCPSDFMILNKDQCHCTSFDATGNNEKAIGVGEIGVKEYV